MNEHRSRTKVFPGMVLLYASGAWNWAFKLPTAVLLCDSAALVSSDELASATRLAAIDMTRVEFPLDQYDPAV